MCGRQQAGSRWHNHDGDDSDVGEVRGRARLGCHVPDGKAGEVAMLV
jgi:hypothetical protein